MGLFAGYEWDAQKARANLRKHGVDFADAVAVFCRETSVSGSPPMKKPRAKDEYDFSGARRGAVVPAPAGKTRITIRIDTEILDWFRKQVHAAGGGNYQTLMNEALGRHVDQKEKTLEDTLRRVIREELQRARRGSAR